MSDTAQASDALVDKVRKLLALANNAGATEAEAASASAMVQKLMAAYNIEMHQLDDMGKGKHDDGKRGKRQHDKAAMYQFQRDLMAALAKNNFCRHFIQEVNVPHEKQKGQFRKAKRHFLLGREVNILATEMTYDYLTDTMDRLLPYQGMDKRGKNALLWLLGCTERLVERLNGQRKQSEAESAAKAKEEAARSRHPGAASSGGNALVLAEVYSNEDDLNTDFVQGLEPGTTTRNRLEREARYAAQVAAWKAKEAQLIADGVPADDAYYIARYGHIPAWVSEARAETARAMAKPAKPETEAQRRKREEKAERDSNRYYQQHQRRNAHRDTEAFQAGAKAGADISLNKQIDEKKQGRLS